MAREAGQYRRMLLEQQEQQKYHHRSTIDTREQERAEDAPVPWFRIRFYISLILFVCYILLDYSGASILEVDSRQILAAVTQDMTEDLHVDTVLEQLAAQIQITEEDYP